MSLEYKYNEPTAGNGEWGMGNFRKVVVADGP